MLQDRIVTQSVMMPAALYLKLLVKIFLQKNWPWGIVLVSFLAVLGIFTDNAVYVAVILFFAAIPVVVFHFFVAKLTRPKSIPSVSYYVMMTGRGITIRGNL